MKNDRCVIIFAIFAIMLTLLMVTSCTISLRSEKSPQINEGVNGREPVTGDGDYKGDERPDDVVYEGAGDRGDEGDAWRIRVITVSGEEIWSFTEAELRDLPPGQSEVFNHAYSTINNWPSARYYVAEGYSVECILQMAGVLETAQTITFRAADGYEASLTREQLLDTQYFYPQAGESADDAEPVVPVIAFRWREGTADLNDLRDDRPSLVFGQRNPFEHTNPAFVEDVAEIIVDEGPCETWEQAYTFPLPGTIAEGETVKLQHQFFGLVKLHYTLDGSDPTSASPMYNPSTYQPELNAPIKITEPTTIKVLVTGYGKKDSEIAEFKFDPVQ